MTLCAVCGRSLLEPSSTGRPRVYCSAGCRREREATLTRIRSRLDDLERERAQLERGDPAALLTVVNIDDSLANIAAAIQRECARWGVD